MLFVGLAAALNTALTIAAAEPEDVPGDLPAQMTGSPLPVQKFGDVEPPHFQSGGSHLTRSLDDKMCSSPASLNVGPPSLAPQHCHRRSLSSSDLAKNQDNKLPAVRGEEDTQSLKDCTMPAAGISLTRDQLSALSGTEFTHCTFCFTPVVIVSWNAVKYLYDECLYYENAHVTMKTHVPAHFL